MVRQPQAVVIPGDIKGCVLWVCRQMMTFEGSGESSLPCVSRAELLVAPGGLGGPLLSFTLERQLRDQIAVQPRPGETLSNASPRV